MHVSKGQDTTACYVALFTEMKEAVQLAFQENNVSLHHEQQSFSVDIENNGVTDHKGIRTSGSKNSPALHHPFLNTLSKVSNGNDFFKNWICYNDTTIGLLCVIMDMLYTSRQTLAGSALALA